jgi:deoxyribonuclease IV
MARLDFTSATGDFLGAHVSTKGGISSAFNRARAISASAMAIFTKNANQWKAKPLTEADCSEFSTARGELKTQPLLAHASYLINLATTNEEFYAKALVGMADELQRAARLCVDAVVLHPGAHMGAGVEKGLEQIARSFDRIHRDLPGNSVLTLLETAAGQGSCVGCSFEELGTILKLVDDPSRLAVCVDTCHIFAAGYDIRTRAGYEAMVDEMLEHIGIENVAAFHLNDSKKPLGSRVDRHEHIGKGEIGLDAFAFLLNDERFARVPKVIETPKSEAPLDENLWDIENLTRLRSLVGTAARKS